MGLIEHTTRCLGYSWCSLKTKWSNYGSLSWTVGVIWGSNVVFKHLLHRPLYSLCDTANSRSDDLFLNLHILRCPQKTLETQHLFLSNSKETHRSTCLTCLFMVPGITDPAKKLAFWNYRNFLCIMRLSWLRSRTHKHILRWKLLYNRYIVYNNNIINTVRLYTIVQLLILNEVLITVGSKHNNLLKWCYISAQQLNSSKQFLVVLPTSATMWLVKFSNVMKHSAVTCPSVNLVLSLSSPSYRGGLWPPRCTSPWSDEWREVYLWLHSALFLHWRPPAHRRLITHLSTEWTLERTTASLLR